MSHIAKIGRRSSDPPGKCSTDAVYFWPDAAQEPLASTPSPSLTWRVCMQCFKLRKIFFCLVLQLFQVFLFWFFVHALNPCQQRTLSWSASVWTKDWRVGLCVWFFHAVPVLWSGQLRNATRRLWFRPFYFWKESAFSVKGFLSHSFFYLYYYCYFLPDISLFVSRAFPFCCVLKKPMFLFRLLSHNIGCPLQSSEGLGEQSTYTLVECLKRWHERNGSWQCMMADHAYSFEADPALLLFFVRHTPGMAYLVVKRGPYTGSKEISRKLSTEAPVLWQYQVISLSTSPAL